MIFTLYYMYATVMQWWRLGSLKNKLNGTLNTQNALMVSHHSVIFDSRKLRSFENLLFRNDDRIGCTIVPKQKVNLSNWVPFPKNVRNFPIYFRHVKQSFESPRIYILVQSVLDEYTKHHSDIIQIEKFGEPVAWKTSDYFEIILKTDIDKLTKLVHCFSNNDLDINHELKLMKLETVDVEGQPAKIKYEKKFSRESHFKYSHSPVHWRKFSTDVRELYSKIRQETNPKITIENGGAKVEDVKPAKKDAKKDVKKEEKNTLEVTRQRHKSKEKKVVKEDTKLVEAKKTDLENGDLVDAKVEEKIIIPKIVMENSSDNLEEACCKELIPEEHKTTEKVKVKKSAKDRDKLRKDEKSREREMKHKEKEAKDAKKKDKEVKIKEKEKRERKKLKDAFKSESLSKRVDETCAAEAEAEAEEVKINGSIANGTKPVKPPNILVFADSLIAKENVKEVLQQMLNKDKYTIYDLPTNPKQQMWNSTTVLVIVCGAVPANLTDHLLHYLLSGGQLLCLCSDLLYSVLHTFTTAEVREHELVRFSYDQWQHIKMMHHIFCYQASPAKKQFSKDSDHSNPSSGNGSSPIAPRTPSTAEIQHNGKDYQIKVQVLGTEETWQSPSLLLATVKGTKGRAIFSQVHLEINPNQYEEDESKFSALTESNQARLEILKDILSKYLDIDCSSYSFIPYTPAYFLGKHDMKLEMLLNCDKIVDNTLVLSKLKLRFCGKEDQPEQATSTNLPILIHSCPTNFSTVKYFETLATETLGRLVLYSDILTCSQDLLEKTLCHGLVVIPRQQTNAIGRSGNTWISPIGCAMFSLQLHIPLDSPLGKAMSLIQHLTMVAVVNAIKNFTGCDKLDIGIKWPNDLYANGNMKIGGLVVNSTLIDKLAVANIGCGLNLSNSDPTTCINDLIRNQSLNFGQNITDISYEKYFAVVFNEFEKLYKQVQSGDMDCLYNLYYKYWLHNNAVITIKTADDESRTVKIVGIDEFGYLKVRAEDGSISSVQPDGNTFDIMKGLIAPKIF